MDGEFFEERVPLFFIPVGTVEDEIFVQEVLEFWILVKLLTQQSAAPSTTREEIEEDPFVLALGLGHGLVDRALEPVLGRGERGDKENDRKKSERFLHGVLTVIHYRRGDAGCQQKAWLCNEDCREMGEARMEIRGNQPQRRLRV